MKDEVFFNKDFTKLSNTQFEGFYKWSELEQSLLKGYRLDDSKGRFYNESNPTLNFNTLLKIWLSDASLEDSQEIKDYEKLLADHKLLFLDETVYVPKFFVASFPRSGNSFTRRILESTSGIFSGSNFSCLPTTNLALII